LPTSKSGFEHLDGALAQDSRGFVGVDAPSKPQNLEAVNFYTTRDCAWFGPSSPAPIKALLASLSGWEFRAATRDGVAVMVEFLLSIPAKGL
jgi:hypothetical protein